jgi:hypothetical protein
MADLITRPDSRPSTPDELAERLLDTQAPQRPLSTPRIRVEVDGRSRTGRSDSAPDLPGRLLVLRIRGAL